jgi:hypothetical protein
MATIFVSIASYRDPICEQTVLNLYESAKNPLNIHVGICQQNRKGDSDCVDLYKDKKWFKNISIMRILDDKAKGPTYARYLCSTLYKNEDYFFQIDSHTKFLKNWDEILVNDMKKLYNRGIKKAVLSHYPKSIEDYNKNTTRDCDVPTLCTSFFNDDKMISFPGAEMHSTNCELMRPTAYIAGGMMFAPGSFLLDIPYDPYLDYLFVGEEIINSIRFYTHGWDIFTPSQNVLYHEYTRADKPKIWTDKKYSDKAAFNKVKMLIGLDYVKSELTDKILKDISVYGLGKERSLSDYYNYTGIDIKNLKVSKNFCSVVK